MKHFVALMLSVLVLPNCVASAAGKAVPDLTLLFPQAGATPTIEGAVAGKRFKNGVMLPVRFEPKPGLSQATATKWCGIVLSQPGNADQALITLGMGTTEALSCDGLLAAGEVSPPKKPQMIGVIYRASTHNAVSLTPLVILRDAASGAWNIDEKRSEALAQQPGKPSLRSMRAYLAKH